MSKFGNNRTLRDGFWFDSEGEANRWGDLTLLCKSGQIRDLRRQVEYPLLLPGQDKAACSYVADFVYVKNDKEIVEDFKSDGTITDMFKLKMRLMKQIYGIDIQIYPPHVKVSKKKKTDPKTLPSRIGYKQAQKWMKDGTITF